jgi:hypothetical protein
LHPDRWYASSDEKLRDEIQEAFYQIQAAYADALAQCAAALRGTAAQQEPITPPSQPAPETPPPWLERLFGFFFRRNTAEPA